MGLTGKITSKMDNNFECSVSEFVALLNQTLEFSFQNIVIVGELANFRVNRNRWVYFDLKDEEATVNFFGSVYQLPGPLEDGMMLKVRGTPRYHERYGFTVTFLYIQPAGEGSIHRSADLLKAKLLAEGLFDESRKRRILYPPASIGLITSKQSAAYADFIKILNTRWRGLHIKVVDSLVQGEQAPPQIIKAIDFFNSQAHPPDAIVLIRGGGSAEDLAVFSTEQVTRAVAGSRVPTLVAIGHEIDTSLAELAADVRASTPSNAAEILVPDRIQMKAQLGLNRNRLSEIGQYIMHQHKLSLKDNEQRLLSGIEDTLHGAHQQLHQQSDLLSALSPQSILLRGYSVIRVAGKIIKSSGTVKTGTIVEAQLADGTFKAKVTLS